jgi:hypothetical protein
MRAILLALLLAFAPAPPDPHFTARWDSDHSATVQWTETGRACLSVLHAGGGGVFIGCDDRVGMIRLELGGVGPLDAAYRPQHDDTYVLVINGVTWRAPLVGRPQYLPLVR